MAKKEQNLFDVSALRQCAQLVLEFRRAAWKRIRDHLAEHQRREVGIGVENIRRVCILASSSRGGSSVTAELLQWQGAQSLTLGRRVFCLPGEEKPHLAILGNAAPLRDDRFDDLTAAEIGVEGVSELWREVSSEIGNPTAICNDLLLYAIQLYRRLLLQWPLQMIQMPIDEAINRIALALNLKFGNIYYDDASNREGVLLACRNVFPFLQTAFYDRGHGPSPRRIPLAGSCWSFEETPFIVPPPWRHASIAEIEDGLLLLRDPSNAWRIPFWRKFFPVAQFEMLHLVRDPREVVQGLCDGWNYPCGFQTIISERGLQVSGYTDIGPRCVNQWKSRRLNFSVSKELSEIVSNAEGLMSLVEICGEQWLGSHRSFMFHASTFGIPRQIITFSDLRSNPEREFRQLCETLGLAVTESGLSYAKTFKEHWVMATRGVGTGNSSRWQHSPFAKEISALVSQDTFRSMEERLLSEGKERTASCATRFKNSLEQVQMTPAGLFHAHNKDLALSLR